MLDFNRLFKKHLIISRKNKKIFTIFDEIRYRHLYNLTNKKTKLTCKDILVLLTLQGEEKFSYYNEGKNSIKFPFDYNLHFENSLYETLTYTITNKTTFIQIIVSIYNIFSPNFCEQEEIPLIKCQGYNIRIFGNNINYNSDIFFPIENKQTVVNYNSLQNEKFEFYLKDEKGKELILFRNKEYTKLKFENFVFFISNSGSKNKKTKQDLISSNEYTVNTKTIDDVYYVNFFHKWYYCNNGLFSRVFRNISHFIKKPINETKTSIYIVFKNEIRKIEKKNIPENWIFDIKDKYKYNIFYFNEIIIYSFEILDKKTNKRLGYGWKQIKYFQENVVNEKLNYLYEPLERPETKYFIDKKLSLKHVLPSFLFLFFVVFGLFSFIVIIILIARRSKP